MAIRSRQAEVVIVGGGLAGLSAAVYLARALRKVLVIDNGRSMARWEPDVQNYLGFPEGIGGPKLLERGRKQALNYGARLVRDEIVSAKAKNGTFHLRGKRGFYTAKRLLLATGIFHIPPELPGLDECLGQSMFFCKDCDGYRIQGKHVAVYGRTGEAVEYALAMLLYSPCVFIVTNGRKPKWSKLSERRIREYHIPAYTRRITDVEHEHGRLRALHFGRGLRVALDALFTTRGDIYYNKLAHQLGAKVDIDGEIRVDRSHRTSIHGLYAAGCVTPANCQMIIAAGEGAAAAQAINRDLFREALRTHLLRRFRRKQVRFRTVTPKVLKA